MTPLIMIIDDSPTMCKVLESITRREGYRAISFPDGFAAMQWLASPVGIVPALILLDLSMPRMDGLSVLRYLKKKPALAAIPAIVLTGREGTIDRLKARLAGAREYVVKPFTTRQIIAVVQMYLGSEVAVQAEATNDSRG
ncbi:MAG: response regulator [Ktedonobacteraceae bacterium]